MEYSLLTPVNAKRFSEMKILVNPNFDEDELTLIIRLQRGDSENGLEIIFEGVRELNINRLYSCSILGPLKILDLKGRQLEGIRYKVSDYEDDYLSFFCKSVSGLEK